MSSIDTLRSHLNGVISDGRIKMPCVVNPKVTTQKQIALFYDDDIDNAAIAIGTQSAYRTKIQVVIRHTDYNKSRTIAYDTYEYIDQNRHPAQRVFLFPFETPRYAGIDTDGGYIWDFEILIKGGR